MLSLKLAIKQKNFIAGLCWVSRVWGLKLFMLLAGCLLIGKIQVQQAVSVITPSSYMRFTKLFSLGHFNDSSS